MERDLPGAHDHFVPLTIFTNVRVEDRLAQEEIFAPVLSIIKVRDFDEAIDAVNNLIAAQHTGQLKQVLKKYLKPSLLILDELGYLPINKNGADLLFQIISERYERGAIVITTNRVFKEWPEIFNNDSTLTSALLDRLLHHTEAVVIEGDSYRMRKVKK